MIDTEILRLFIELDRSLRAYRAVFGSCHMGSGTLSDPDLIFPLHQPIQLIIERCFPAHELLSWEVYAPKTCLYAPTMEGQSLMRRAIQFVALDGSVIVCYVKPIQSTIKGCNK